ncbi:MAG: peptide deformylase [Candidatus Nealsonbacteria bacterium]|nr:peptide deformylase [Candidatus Nealsonbacteria bacterium]
MAILEIKKYPNPILRKKCQRKEEITANIRKLGQDMKETMVKNQGIGLAAPQVGELKRVIAVQMEKEMQVFINPKIIKKSRETEIAEEGCLSFLGLFLKIKRAREVEIKALDIEGKEIQIKAEGLPARVFQHEIDHLDGILFLNRINLWQKLWRLLKN